MIVLGLALTLICLVYRGSCSPPASEERNAHHRPNRSSLRALEKRLHFDFPTHVPVFPVRVDFRGTGHPVVHGRLELIGGVPDLPNNQGVEAENHTLPINPHPKVPYNKMHHALQCARSEPDLEGDRGTLSLNSLVPPTKKRLLTVMTWLESNCNIGEDCAKRLSSFLNDKTYPQGEHLYTGFYYWVRLLRIMGGKLYLDWPWGRDRFKTQLFGELDELFFVLERLSDVPDSVFLFGTQQSYLPWRIPFPAFSESPSFKSNEMPFPWMESFRDALHLYRHMAREKNFSEATYSDYYKDKVLPWNQKIAKAGFAASMIDTRQILFDIAQHRPDLFEASWISGDHVVVEPWNPASSEGGVSKDSIKKMAEKNITNPDNEVEEIGYAKQLFRSRAEHGVAFRPGHYKYLIVLFGGFGNKQHYATSGRLASYLAHSGAVVLLQQSEFNYHFSARLKPWVHYVPISYSTADVVSKIEWLKAHDDMAQRIAANARNFGRSYLRLEDYYCYISTALYTIGALEKDSDVLEPFDPVLIPQSLHMTVNR
eukprot:gene6298-6777_t